MMEFSYYYGNQADQFSFIRIPRVLLVDQLFSPLSIQSKILYGVLLDRMGISMRNGWFDELNRVYIIYQISEIQEDLGFSKKKAIDYLTELEQFGLVEKKRRGRGLPSILYVKSFMTRDAISRSVETGTSEPIISISRSAEIDTSRGSQIAPLEVPESTLLEVPKSAPLMSNNNINNTYMSNIPSNQILSTEGTEVQSGCDEDEMRSVRAYAEIISENLELEILKQGHGYDVELLDGIYDLILEVVVSKSPTNIDDSIENSFNVNQLQEEKEKIAFLEANPDKAETLFTLEDNAMLRGQISIIGLENLDYADRFSSLFSGACHWDKIDCALMSIGNYGQLERNKWRYQFASRSMLYAWNELFHKSANAGFDNTKDVLVKLLATNETFSDDVLQEIIDAFVAECEENQEYPWRYYYVKYIEYRPGSYGKLSNSSVTEKPYLFSALQTKSQWSQNTYLPYLKAADEAHLSRDDMGQRLSYGDEHIICTNSSYVRRRNSDQQVIETVDIPQNASGIDTVDRIILLKEYLKQTYGVESRH